MVHFDPRRYGAKVVVRHQFGAIFEVDRYVRETALRSGSLWLIFDQDKDETVRKRNARETGKRRMYATIAVSPYVQIQGLVTRELPSGLVAIRVAEREYVGARLETLSRAACRVVS